MIHSGTKLFLTAIVLISGLMLLFNLGSNIDYIGRAFYISNGEAGIAEPGQPLPNAMLNINTVFWGLVLALILTYIAAMHLFETKHMIPVHIKEPKKVKKK